MSKRIIEAITELSERFQQWPGTQNRPANPPILVTLGGLLDFYYNSSGPNAGSCGVGFVRADGKHIPELTVFEEGNSTPVLPTTQLANNSVVSLGVVNSAGVEQPPRVEFLKDGSADDFRWMIDMQAQGWYPGTQTKDVYAAKLFVRHGTFFTQTPTKYNLNQIRRPLFEQPIIPWWTEGPLGTPADIVGDEISLGANEKVSVKVNGHEAIRLPQIAAKKYEVLLTNVCFDDKPHNQKCAFDWWDWHEAKRNDFHHHRDALVVSDGTKYSVALVYGQLPVGTHDPEKHLVSTFDAPCMGAGYGGGNGP